MGTHPTGFLPGLARGGAQHQEQRVDGLHHRGARAGQGIRQGGEDGGDQLPLCAQEAQVDSIVCMYVCMLMFV